MAVARGIGAEGLIAAAETLGRPSEEFGNDERVETLWVMKAIEHAEVYFNLLCSIKPSELSRLSPDDDKIHDRFKSEFPNIDVKVIKESLLKSQENKEKWRSFCKEFEYIEDYNFGTLIRLDSELDYSEENSIITTKIQFFAIEISRNRLGYNDVIRSKYKPQPRKGRPKDTDSVTDGGPSGRNLTKEVENELQEILAGKHELLK
ncbi:protein PBDC1 [Lepeophtheirus salmonis]|uniref:protein PBDC1 n=1 Tax=Lepeophtheirus salmonis TaxID=72036 RepID=UPI001AE4A8E2|nr:protein PBDC1-like [Lepeophtheirus salmonis]